ncbi:MAG: LAGLIDADG family homing endonuclease [bacterium]|nr:LAGLIDADG family homing endonuclease [bacterium]
MQSKKVSSAGNQQERLAIENWIVGFADGEGCFTVSLIKNKTTKSGWQVFPEFVVTQGAKSITALQLIQKYFQCGNIFINNRKDNHREPLYRYCVRSIDELQTKIIPFFSRNKLRTAKANDFKIFASIVRMFSKKAHLSKKGMQTIAKLIETMNLRKKSRFLESSETTR